MILAALLLAGMLAYGCLVHSIYRDDLRGLQAENERLRQMVHPSGRGRL